MIFGCAPWPVRVDQQIVKRNPLTVKGDKHARSQGSKRDDRLNCILCSR